MDTLTIDDTLLVMFVDNELDPVTAKLVEEQVAANPVLAERVAMFRDTAALLPMALATPDHLTVPPELAARVERLLDDSRARPARQLGRPMGRRSWLSMAAAASVAGFVLGRTDILNHPPFVGAAEKLVEHFLDEVADYHGVYIKEREHLVEVPASRKEHLEAWLGDRLQLAFQVPDLRDFDFTFQGGRLLGVSHQPVGQLMYTAGDGTPIALCIALVGRDTTSSVRRHDEDDLTLYGQGVGRHVLIVAGPKDHRALRSLIAAMPDLLRPS